MWGIIVRIQELSSNIWLCLVISGFKIKWNAHPRRVNFDIHKVSGIIVAVFLGLISFTGFCWNFYDFTQSIIYGLTSTPNPSNLVSQNITGKSPLNVTQLLQKADAALPDEVTTYVLLAIKPEDAIAVGKKLLQESWKFGYSQIYLDHYTGEILQLKNGLKASLGEKIWDSFGARYCWRISEGLNPPALKPRLCVAFPPCNKLRANS
ncbi:PepSY-associated TM helix domain-containing protein [Nostoc sp.]